MSLDKIEISKEDEPKCTGLVYRADVASVRTKRGFMFSIRMNELKKRSCACGRCSYIRDVIGDESMYIDGMLGLGKARHNKLYTINIVNESTDFETGHIDDFDLQISEMEQH